jgi:very-short-patch-repair endonuclease
MFQSVSPIVTSYYVLIGWGLLAFAILLEFMRYKKTPEERNFIYEEPKQIVATPQAVKLSEALRIRGINNEREHNDGYKHVDIYIPEANLYVELDGKYHLTDPNHLFRDLQRDACSHKNGIETIHIPNFYVENNLDEVANAIAEVVRKRQASGIYRQSHKIYRYRRY